MNGVYITSWPEIENEIRRTKFECPDGVEDYAFWLLGIDGYHSWPFEDAFEGRGVDRMLVMSPFLTGSSLERLAVPKRKNVVVSRPEALDQLGPSELIHFENVYVLQDGVDPESSEVGGNSLDESSVDLSGLHAKVFVADVGWNARVWTGSANATHHAFETNVEFLIELLGKRSQIGIDALLGDPKDKWSLSRLLQPYDMSNGPQPLPDKDGQAMLDDLRHMLAGISYRLEVKSIDGSSKFDLILYVPPMDLSLIQDVEIQCRPISLSDIRYLPIFPMRNENTTVIFADVSLESITSFLAFRIKENRTGQQVEFLCNVTLDGAPEGRQESLLKSMLTNKSEVLRYLLLLLSEGATDRFADSLLMTTKESGDHHATENGFADIPILESIIRALHTNPNKLVQVQSFIAEFQGRDSESLLPDGFLAVWEPIWAVAKEVVAAHGN